MALTAKKSTTYLANKALSNAINYNFFQLVEYVYKLNHYNLESEQDISPSKEIIRFNGSGSLGFPASDITAAGIKEFEDKIQYWIETSFFSMHGSSSPLPGHFLDIIAWEFSQKEGVRYQFLDFFNHRLTTLLHRAWRKYRYFIRYQPEGSDNFSKYCFALIGVHDIDLRRDSSIHWSRLLKFSGIISSQHRPSGSIRDIVAHYFNHDSIEIKEWVQRNVQIAPEQLSRLGTVNFNLGQNFMLGEYVPTRMGKFIISITNLTITKFQDFLPNGKNYSILLELIAFLLKNQQAYDIELGLLPSEIPDFQLTTKNKHPALLGWSTLLSSSVPETKNTFITIGAVS